MITGLHQTAGVVLRKDFIAEKDCDVIMLLRQNGAIILGLTNVPELCMWLVPNHILLILVHDFIRYILIGVMQDEYADMIFVQE